MNDNRGVLDISVVIPVFNEEESLSGLYSQLKEVLDGLGKTYEIIFVDDGSTDNSFNILKSIHKKDGLVKVIRFQGNFGKSASLSAGFEATLGEFVITMDADLQDNPSEIPKFIEKIGEDFDLVVGWRYKRMDPLPRVILSRFFNYMTSFLTGVGVHDSNCGFKIFRRRVLDTLNIHGGLHRYIPSIVKLHGYRVGEVKVNHQKRRYGKSKYGLWRLTIGFFDLITVMALMIYLKHPMHFFGLFGILFLVVGFIMGLYMVYLRLIDEVIGGRPFLLLSVLLLVFGFQAFSLGFIGEMLANTRMKHKYTIRERL